MIAFALALALLAPQDGWKLFGGEEDGGLGLSVELASIRAEGDIRTAHARMAQAENDSFYMLIELRIDCSERTLLFTHGFAYRSGELVPDQREGGSPDFDATGDSRSTPVIDYICAA